MARPRCYDEIYKIVDKYDPVGISWASSDEYQPEVIKIANRAFVLTEKSWLIIYTKCLSSGFRIYSASS